MLLEVVGIRVRYGPVEAVKGVSLEVEEGSIVTLLGANGAGKTTTLRAIVGLKRAAAGEIWFRGERIDGRPTPSIVKRGVSLCPEGRHVFSELTVGENLMLGAYLRRDKDGIKKDLEEVFGHFPHLRERTGQRAGSLSGGEQQMLAMGRALMGRPQLLLLDEPSLGLSPILAQEIAKVIREVNARGVSIILVEQNATMALGLASKGYVMEAGQVVLQGDAKDLLGNEGVRRAYLGN
ncbi:MAG: ABC transporter ATP-binding protein [Chloroflexi bacterium]|nr:ABC transporter ATP-binding protein [Chloroflexota bacterium]